MDETTSSSMSFLYYVLAPSPLKMYKTVFENNRVLSVPLPTISYFQQILVSVENLYPDFFKVSSAVFIGLD